LEDRNTDAYYRKHKMYKYISRKRFNYGRDGEGWYVLFDKKRPYNGLVGTYISENQCKKMIETIRWYEKNARKENKYGY